MTGYTPGPIAKFLNDASERIATANGAVPFNPTTGNAVIGWLRARVPADDSSINAELLAALKAVLALPQNNTAIGGSLTAVRDAHAAIAKAEGRS
mgnify:CR=1 FL=1